MVDILEPSIKAWHRGGQALTLVLGELRFAQFGAGGREADAQALYEVRNHASVRPFMPSPEPLPLAQHLAWVREKLDPPGDDSPLVLIGRSQAQEPVGFGLLKPVAPGVLEVGAMLVGDWQNSALPARLVAGLVMLAHERLGAAVLLTHVSPAHAQALRFNRGWGLREVPSAKPGELCLRAPIAEVLATPLYRRCARGIVVETRPSITTRE